MATPPLVITLSEPHTFVGPGALVGLRSNFLGPWPVGSDFEISVYSNDGTETLGWFQEHATTSSVAEVRIADDADNYTSRGTGLLKEGEAVTVIAALREAGHSDLVDENSIQAVWSPTAGLGDQVRTQTVAAIPDPESAQLLLANNAAAQVQFPTQLAIPGQFRDLGAWQSTFLNHAAYLRGTPLAISGDGAIDLGPSSQARGCLGIKWTFETVPAGFGRTHGVADLFELRIVQFGLVRQDFGLDTFVQEFRDVHQDGAQWLWGDPFALQLAYSVTPGCLVIVTPWIFPS